MTEHHYGEDVEIIKLECVGHVQKRMVTALRKLKSGIEDENGQLMKFKCRLTDNVITAVMRVPSETTKMTLMGWYIIEASFLHSMSTDEHPMHMEWPEHNPPDKISWCRFKVAAYENSTPEPHNPYIPRDLAMFVLFTCGWLIGNF